MIFVGIYRVISAYFMSSWSFQKYAVIHHCVGVCFAGLYVLSPLHNTRTWRRDQGLTVTANIRIEKKTFVIFDDNTMPRKSNLKIEWNICLRCKLMIHSSDANDHEKQCKQGQSLSHGFTINSVLHATVSRTLAKDLPDVPSAIKGDVIYIHPKAMVLCNICLGQPCIVGGSHILYAWASHKVHPSSVSFPPTVGGSLVHQAALEGKLVTVESFEWKPETAQQVNVELKTTHQAFLKDDFLHYLPHKMDGRYIKEGSTYTILYFGLTCTFSVKSTQSAPVSKCEVTCISPSPTRFQSDQDLSQTFSEIDLSSVSESGVTDTSLSLAGGVTDTSLSQDLDCTNNLISDAGDVTDMDTSLSTLEWNPKCETDCVVTELRTSLKLDSSAMDLNDVSKSPSLVTGHDQIINPLVQASTGSVNSTGGSTHKGVVTSDAPPCQFVEITARTKFVLVRSDCEKEKGGKKKVSFDFLGGMDKQIKTIRELFDLHLNKPQLGQLYGLTFSRGILLYGPSGTGKTTLAQAVASEMPVFTVNVSVTDVMSKFVGETEKKLRALFQSASERSPSLIIIDSLDGFCPRRDESNSDLEKRVVATFLTLLDGLATKKSSSVCLVLGITNNPDSIDPALRRPGRLDCDVETGVPTADERLQILQKLLQPIPHSIGEGTLKTISDARHGFVGADLALLVRKAAEIAVKKCRRGATPLLTAEDLLQAVDSVSPSAMKEVMLEVPRVRWSDIGGQAEVKLKLRQAVEWQLKHPEVFSRFGISPPRGILMYGPPGCSKTMVAKALATESGLNFLAVKGPECFSKWVGESERAVREVFSKARAAAPSIIFFDEIDALAVERGSGGSNVADRVLTQLLTEMDGVERLSGVCVVAATNRPDKIDQALLRPGRFDQILYVPLPDADTRKEIVLIEFRKKPVAGDVSVEELVNRTVRYSGAELSAVCNEAALAALQEDIHSQEIRRHHFDIALSTVKPVTSPERVKFYEDYSKRRQSGLRFV